MKDDKMYKKFEEIAKTFLGKEDLYMNPSTGSVAEGEEWLGDFLDAWKDVREMWELWGGQKLVEVVWVGPDEDDYKEVYE